MEDAGDWSKMSLKYFWFINLRHLEQDKAVKGVGDQGIDLLVSCNNEKILILYPVSIKFRVASDSTLIFQVDFSITDTTFVYN